MDLLAGFGNEKMSVVKDPFSKKNVNAIFIHFTKSFFDEKWTASGSIKFKNGDTEGKQEFEGKSIDEIILKMKACLEAI